MRLPLLSFGIVVICLIPLEPALSQPAAAPPGIYFDISRCRACAYDNWHREVTSALLRDGFRAFSGSATVVNQNVTGIIRKANPDMFLDDVFVGPYLSEGEVQRATDRLVAGLSSINKKRIGEPRNVERSQPYLFKVGDFDVMIRDLRTEAQRQSENLRNSAAQERHAATECSSAPGHVAVTQVELTLLLGIGAARKPNCEYTSRDGLRSFSIGTSTTNIANQTAPQIFTEQRNLMGSLGGLLRDEPSFGTSAFSCVWFDAQGGRNSAFVVLKGTRVLGAVVAEKQPDNRELTTQLVDRLRPIVKRILLGL